MLSRNTHVAGVAEGVLPFAAGEELVELCLIRVLRWSRGLLLDWRFGWLRSCEVLNRVWSGVELVRGLLLGKSVECGLAEG